MREIDHTKVHISDALGISDEELTTFHKELSDMRENTTSMSGMLTKMCNRWGDDLPVLAFLAWEVGRLTEQAENEHDEWETLK
jgi:hypothetical protein